MPRRAGRPRAPSTSPRRWLLLPQGTTPAGAATSLKISFARDRDSRPAPLAGGPAGKPSAAASDALEAALAMQQYSSWEPKAFDESVLKQEQEQQERQAQKAQKAQGQQQGQAQGQQQGQQQAGGKPGGEGQGGFVYDSASGYWYDAASGYYYDANTQLYYHQSTQQWYALDAASGQYKAVGAGGSSGGSSAAAPAAGAAGAAGAGAGAAAAASAAAAAAAPKKKVAAVIGSKPQVNYEALREAQLEKVGGWGRQAAGGGRRQAARCHC
jgi:RNA-binding protein 5/10